MSQKKMYGPCPCGSGKKYKFCCYLKRPEQAGARGMAQFWAGASCEDPFVDEFQNVDARITREVLEIFNKGFRLMSKGKHKKAIPLFRKAVSHAPDIYPSANNLAVCLFATGALDEACEVQRASLEAISLENPFGWGNLAGFEYIRGNEDEAKRCLEKAVKMKSPNPDACVKVCESLGRFKRHQDILDYIDANAFNEDPGVSFYSGVAAANVGDFRRAKCDLKQVKHGYFKHEIAQRYLRLLTAGETLHSVRGDWPYLLVHEVCPPDLIAAEAVREGSEWLSRCVLVDLCEALLNDQGDNSAEMIDALPESKHPEASELLWAIVKGDFGPDALRLKALSGLHKRGEIGPKDHITVLQKGEYQEVASASTELNWDFSYGPSLPEKWSRLYDKAYLAGKKKNPDLEAIGGMYLKVLEAAPGCFPAEYNYATTLIHRNRIDEAVVILKRVRDEHPDYLFAAATLLQIYCAENREEEAEALLKAMVLPPETHPSAMIAWLMATASYFYMMGDDAAAERCVEEAYRIDPDSPVVKMVRQG